MAHFTDKPLADHGLVSFRYRGRYSWIMICATSVDDALNEAIRSTGYPVTRDLLQVWTGEPYKWVNDI